MWINLREEPIIYIKSKPFVLREASHPFINLNTYSKISILKLKNFIKLNKN